MVNSHRQKVRPISSTCVAPFSHHACVLRGKQHRYFALPSSALVLVSLRYKEKIPQTKFAHFGLSTKFGRKTCIQERLIEVFKSGSEEMRSSLVEWARCSHSSNSPFNSLKHLRDPSSRETPNRCGLV